MPHINVKKAIENLRRFIAYSLLTSLRMTWRLRRIYFMVAIAIKPHATINEQMIQWRMDAVDLVYM